jgi:hypothetical protein
MANQLLALLQSRWPGATEIFAEIDSPITLAFVQRYPTADSAARLGEKRLRPRRQRLRSGPSKGYVP